MIRLTLSLLPMMPMIMLQIPVFRRLILISSFLDVLMRLLLRQPVIWRLIQWKRIRRITISIIMCRLSIREMIGRLFQENCSHKRKDSNTNSLLQLEKLAQVKPKLNSVLIPLLLAKVWPLQYIPRISLVRQSMLTGFMMMMRRSSWDNS